MNTVWISRMHVEASDVDGTMSYASAEFLLNSSSSDLLRNVYTLMLQSCGVCRRFEALLQGGFARRGQPRAVGSCQPEMG